jgi:hypothetical protein
LATLFATKRLFFVYRSADRGVNLGRSVLLHAGQDVAVEVERYSDARMAQALLRHLWDERHSSQAASRASQEWSQPKPLPNGLAPVASFDTALLPETIAPWVADIAERMQCPPGFVAIPAMVVLGAVIARKTGIRPQPQTVGLRLRICGAA